jgi:hypothetical protein
MVLLPLPPVALGLDGRESPRCARFKLSGAQTSSAPVIAL